MSKSSVQTPQTIKAPNAAISAQSSLFGLSSVNIGMGSSAPRPALASARIIEDLDSISYPDGTRSPHPDLNVNAEKGKFRYVVHDGP
jgi:translation initiation factor 4G